MSDPKSVTKKEFHEWMITRALSEYLKGLPSDRMRWFLEQIDSETPGRVRTLSELCGFTARTEQIQGGAEIALTKKDDLDKMTEADSKEYLWMTPDFRYWTSGKKKQLIIEAKGTPSPSKKDSTQARRYFRFLKAFGAVGAVVYLVPEQGGFDWLAWLGTRAKDEDAETFGINWGILRFGQIVPNIADDLVKIVGATLVESATLLEQALQASKAARPR